MSVAPFGPDGGTGALSLASVKESSVAAPPDTLASTRSSEAIAAAIDISELLKMTNNGGIVSRGHFN